MRDVRGGEMGIDLCFFKSSSVKFLAFEGSLHLASSVSSPVFTFASTMEGLPCGHPAGLALLPTATLSLLLQKQDWYSYSPHEHKSDFPFAQAVSSRDALTLLFKWYPTIKTIPSPSLWISAPI